MSIKEQRVAISFTVEMGEIPQRIADLLGELPLQLGAAEDDLEAAVQSISAAPEDTQSAYQSIESARRILNKIDLRFEDCQHLLRSYQTTMANLSAQTMDAAATQKPTADTEE